MRTGRHIYRPQRRYAPGWVRLSGGLLTAWKVRPSGPDRGLVRPAAYAPGKEWVPQAGEVRKEVMPDTHAASGLGDA